MPGSSVCKMEPNMGRTSGKCDEFDTREFVIMFPYVKNFPVRLGQARIKLGSIVPPRTVRLFFT